MNDRPKPILVLGASGTVGKLLLGELASCGIPVRAACHTRPIDAPNVEPVRVDATTGTGLNDALANCGTLFLLMGDMPQQLAAEVRVIEAAAQHGVDRIVKLSVLGAESESFAFARVHRAAEKAIEETGITHTFLRPGGFMQNFVSYYGMAIQHDATIRLPCGDSREAFIDARDIAAVAATVLTDVVHNNTAYDLCGGEAISYSAAADKLSTAIGRTISYCDVSEKIFRDEMGSAGVPEQNIEALIELYRFHRSGQASSPSRTVEDLLDRPPITFDKFAADYVECWR